MVFSAKILGIACFSLLLIPAIAYAENYTIKTNNQTINIVINPNDITVKPNNTIIVKPNITIVESKNNTKLEQILQKISEKEDPKWHQGDVLIGSATIVGFFGIGSYISIRFREDTKTISLILLGSVITTNGIIIFLHLYVMLLIVRGLFDVEMYNNIITFTMTGVFFNVYCIIRINYYENRRKRGASKPSEFKKLVEEVEKELERNLKNNSTQHKD